MQHMAKSGEAGPRSKPTAELLRFAVDLSWSDVPDDVRHTAKRHLLDTVGAMIAGAQGDITVKAESLLAAIRPSGPIPVPGRTRPADLLDAAFLGGISAHGIELDDGFTQGAVHPGAPIVSALLPIAYDRHASGADLLVAMIAGYQALLAIAEACHPSLRRRGFHPTGVIGVLGASVAAARLLGLSEHDTSNALGLAASSAAGLHAYVSGGADVKRLHGGHAAREGLQAALLGKARHSRPARCARRQGRRLPGVCLRHRGQGLRHRHGQWRPLPDQPLLYQGFCLLPASAACRRRADMRCLRNIGSRLPTSMRSLSRHIILPENSPRWAGATSPRRSSVFRSTWR